jgi:predicted ArsR family transcriptional regulator
MAALSNLTPDFDQYGRDPNSPPEKLRRRTDYEKRSGWVPLPFAFLADLPRLTSGQACSMLILMIHAEAQGRRKYPNEPPPDWTLAHSLEYWASLCRCDIRTVQRERDQMKARGMVEFTVDTKRRTAFRLLYRGWQAIPDWSEWIKTHSPVEPKPEPEAPAVESEPRFRATVQHGSQSKPFRLNCAVQSFQLENRGKLDFKFEALVKAGVLVLAASEIAKRMKGEEAGEEKANTSIDSTSSKAHERHGRHPGFASSSPKINPARRTQGEHPRAEELSALFDPLLLRSCGKSLSADPVALQSACEAAGAVDHDFLVKWVVDRFERPVKAPKHCKAILQECRENWEKMKDLPPIRKLPTMADIDAMIAQERAAKKRRA